MKQCSLIELSRLLSTIFGQQPPVYARPPTMPPEPLARPSPVGTPLVSTAETQATAAGPQASLAPVNPTYQNPLQTAVYEKIQASIRELHEKMITELNTLYNINESLKNGRELLVSANLELPEEKSRLVREIESLDRRIHELDSVMNNPTDDLSKTIEEFQVTDEPLHRQYVLFSFFLPGDVFMVLNSTQ